MIIEGGMLLLKDKAIKPEFAISFEATDDHGLYIQLDNAFYDTSVSKFCFCTLTQAHLKELREFLLTQAESELLYDSDGKDINPEFTTWYQTRKKEMRL